MSSQGLTVRLGQLEIFAEETGKGSPTLVIAALNVKDVVLVGHSMGGKIAQIVAGRRLEGLRAVVVPQARFETLEGVGHLSPLEAPGELAEAIAEFIETKAERTPHDTK